MPRPFLTVLPPSIPVNLPVPKSEPTPDIQEILRKRREMLNRVKADLERVGKLQQEFREAGLKPTPEPETGKEKSSRS